MTSISHLSYHSLASVEDIRVFLQHNGVTIPDENLGEDVALSSLSKFLNSPQKVPFLFERQLAKFDVLVATNSAKPKYLFFMYHSKLGNALNYIKVARTVVYLASANNVGVCVVIPNGNIRDGGGGSENPCYWWRQGVSAEDRESEGSIISDTQSIKSNKLKSLMDKGIKKLNLLKSHTNTSHANILLETEKVVHTNKLLIRMQKLVDTCCNLLDISPSNVSQVGFGQGAILCLQLLYNLRVAPKCTILVSVGDVQGQQSYDDIFHCMGDQARLQWRESSVIQIHGKADYVFPWEEAREVYKRLKRHGMPVTFMAHNGGYAWGQYINESLDSWMMLIKKDKESKKLNEVYQAPSPSVPPPARNGTIPEESVYIHPGLIAVTQNYENLPKDNLYYDSQGGYNPMINASAIMADNSKIETSLWNLSGFHADVPFDLTGVDLQESVLPGEFS